ncbi:TetR/AcrR family transcriptional regulator [Nocardia alni]|uniref:TetR/AcrR family transcriptional regulator n=1 Tax=Nocardia alni TaxID=2815723 RepID=UPI001C24A69E|nr:TetR/AcrR family transcriptional regulator [Nocardia alni]
MPFQRARSEEQREIRRRTILDTASTMLESMPAAEVSLNELSRRACLAKSNVLRYFESREAILLELLDRAMKRWLAELSGRLTDEIDPAAAPGERGDRIAATLTRSLVPERMLCDLLSSQAGVLGQKISVEVVAAYKRAMFDNNTTLAGLVGSHLPELDAEAAWRLCATALILTGALWGHTHHSASVLAAYQADPSLAPMHMDFAETLQDSLTTAIAGTLARAGASPTR